MENKLYPGAGTLLRYKTISKNLKIKIYMTLIPPINQYGMDLKHER